VARRRRNAESAGEKQNAMEVGFGAVVCLLVGVRCSWQGLSCVCERVSERGRPRYTSSCSLLNERESR